MSEAIEPPPVTTRVKPEILKRGSVYGLDTLTPYNLYSQWGEDGLVDGLLDALGEPCSKWACEFGAADGLMFSNTRRLFERGWSGLLIEREEALFHKLVENTKFENVICWQKSVEVHGENRLDCLLLEAKAPEEFDVLSIDIDGQDCWVWNSLLHYWPKIVLIEVEPHISAPFPTLDAPYLVQAGIDAMMKIACSKGYTLAGATYNNAVFFRSDLEDLVIKGERQLVRLA